MFSDIKSINGKSFTTYELDSDETILERIAVQENSLPEYIKIVGDGPQKKTINLVKQISNYPSHEFENFYNFFKDEFPKIDFETFSKLWYIYSLDRGKNINPLITIALEDFLQKHSSSLAKMSEFESFYSTLKIRMESLNKKVKQSLKDFKEFSSYEGIPSTPLEVVRVKTELLFEVEYDIYELFNYMKMSRDIPFAVIGSYYKIMEGFIPSDRWSYTRERLEGDFGDKRDVLYLKILNIKNEPLQNYGKTDPNLYSTVSIYFETPQEELKRKRETRLREEETTDKEKKRVEKKRKEEEKRKKEEESTTIIRRKKKDGVGKSVDEIRREREEIKKEKEEKEREERKEAERIEKEERNLLKESEEIKISELENEIVRTSKVYMRIESEINPDLNEEDLINRVLESFPSKINIQSKKQVQIKAEFLIPNFYLDSPLFLDVLLNDRMFYQRCFVDERLRIQKEKGVYIYYAFDTSDTDDKFVACSMTEQIVEKTNLKIIAKDPELKIDTPYLRIRITRVPDEKIAEKFKNIFTRLLSLYQDRKESIIEKYNNYIPDFENYLLSLKSEIEKKRKKSTRDRKMLKDVDPDQFISGYSRWLCPTKRAPKIIGIKDPNSNEDPPEVEKLRRKNGPNNPDVQVMLFPRDPIDNDQKYNQYYYSCEHHGVSSSGKPVKNAAIYPGLRINALGNSEKYPIVPCCYTKDNWSKNKDKSIIRQYYEDNQPFSFFRNKKKGEEDEDEKHIFTTNKIVPLKRLGVLIKNVDMFFKSIDNSHTYYRQGVTQSFNSIIEVLLMATEGKKFDKYTKEERSDRVSDVRNELVSLAKNSDIYQQTVLYSRNKDSIESYLKDKNKYLDPKMFTRLIEDYFKCYLFIFSQNEQYPLGVLSSPHNLKEYLSKKKNDVYPTIFIYEHMGSELDKAVYPQCELIIRQNTKGEKQFTFKNNFDIIVRTQTIFN